MGRRAAVAVLLAMVALALHVTLARRLDDLGVFAQRDVLFDADIKTRLLALSGGKHLGIKHPNLMPYFTPPVALVAKAITTLSPASGAEAAVRRAVGTLVVPVASALKTAVVFLVFCNLGFPPASAVVATLLEMVSFSTLVFGSIPESYGLTALAVVLAYACATGSSAEPTWRRIGVWVAIGVFATGVTVTNVVLVTLLFWAAAWKAWPRLVPATVRAAAFAVVVFGVTGVSAYVLDAMLVPKPPPAPGVAPAPAVVDRVLEPFTHEVDAFAAPDPARKLRRFPTAVVTAFSPSSAAEPLTSDMRRPMRNPPPVALTLERTPDVFGRGAPFGLALLVLLVAGAACSLALPATRPIAAASLAICAFSWGLSVWGMETLLYSQHWHLAAVVLLAGVMRMEPRARPMTALVGAVTVAIAVNNLVRLHEILAVVAAAQPVP
jgi:hypothetical protein